MSRLPFTNLFYEIVALIAPKFFERGESVLDDACTDISNWPPIVAGECIQLPILSTIFQTYIPSLTSANLQQVHTQQPQHKQKQEPQQEEPQQEEPQYPIENDKSANDDDDNKEKCEKIDENIESNVMPMDSDNNEKENKSSIELSREDILESYKQSKEMLLTNEMNSMKLAHCSKDSIDDSKYDDCESDDINDDDSYSDIKSDALSIDSKTFPISRQIFPSTSSTRTLFVLSSVQEIDIFRSLYSVLSYTHLLWELVLTAEPIVVMGTSPSDCSHMVQSLMR